MFVTALMPFTKHAPIALIVPIVPRQTARNSWLKISDIPSTKMKIMLTMMVMLFYWVLSTFWAWRQCLSARTRATASSQRSVGNQIWLWGELAVGQHGPWGEPLALWDQNYSQRRGSTICGHSSGFLGGCQLFTVHLPVLLQIVWLSLPGETDGLFGWFFWPPPNTFSGGRISLECKLKWYQKVKGTYIQILDWNVNKTSTSRWAHQN